MYRPYWRDGNASLSTFSPMSRHATSQRCGWFPLVPLTPVTCRIHQQLPTVLLLNARAGCPSPPPRTKVSVDRKYCHGTFGIVSTFRTFSKATLEEPNIPTRRTPSGENDGTHTCTHAHTHTKLAKSAPENPPPPKIYQRSSFRDMKKSSTPGYYCKNRIA